MDTRNINVYPVWVETKVNSSLETTIKIMDSHRDTRKENVNIVLPDLPIYMVSHIAKKCMEALHEIKKRTQFEINSVIKRG